MNITTKPYSQASETISLALADELTKGPVLLLLSGGSATTVYAELAKSLKLNIQPGDLVVGLVDERYDLDPTHPEANDVAIRATGIITHLEQLGAIYSPILHGHPIEEEVAQYNYQLTQFMIHERRRVIAILGIGFDGHTAGVLPDTNAERFKQHFEGDQLVTGYLNDGPFSERITLTLTALRMMERVVILVKDETKSPVIKQATNASKPPIHLMPAAVMQELKDVTILAPK